MSITKEQLVDFLSTFYWEDGNMNIYADIARLSGYEKLTLEVKRDGIQYTYLLNEVGKEYVKKQMERGGYPIPEMGSFTDFDRGSVESTLGNFNLQDVKEGYYVRNKSRKVICPKDRRPGASYITVTKFELVEPAGQFAKAVLKEKSGEYTLEIKQDGEADILASFGETAQLFSNLNRNSEKHREFIRLIQEEIGVTVPFGM